MRGKRMLVKPEPKPARQTGRDIMSNYWEERCRVVKPTPAVTKTDHARLADLGLTVISYQNVATAPDENGGTYWLPRDIIGRDGKTLIRWYEAGDSGNTYASHGWEPWHDGMFGGHYESLSSALAWVERARAIRAGTATDFRGR
jgi:hypothetical protein